MEVNTVYCGDALQVLKTFPTGEIDCCVTSPPYYGLRDYGVEGQLGLEETPEEYIDKMVEIFNEVKRVLKDDGTLWLNIGDSYAAQRSGTHQPACHIPRRIDRAMYFSRQQKRGDSVRPFFREWDNGYSGNQI